MELELFKAPVLAALHSIRRSANALRSSLSNPARVAKPLSASAIGGPLDFATQWRVIEVKLNFDDMKKFMKEGVLQRESDGRYVGRFDFLLMKEGFAVSKGELHTSASPVRTPFDAPRPDAPVWEFWIPLGVDAQQRVQQSPESWVDGDMHSQIWRLVKKLLGP